MDAIDQYVDSIVNAKVSFNGNRINDGKYTFIVKKLLAKKSDKNASKAYFIAEFFVEEAEAVDVQLDMMRPAEKANGNQISPPNKPGTEVSVAIDLSSENGPKNVKAILCGLDNIDPNALNDSPEGKAKFATLLRGSVGAANPFRGARVRCTTSRKGITKGTNMGQPFTANRWDPVTQTTAEVASNRTKLDALDKKAPTP